MAVLPAGLGAIMRVRLVYSKRGGACFVPHIALAQIFARSALRAGFMPEMTQGFSPRARLSFAPELPAGVVALNEPVDMYFSGNPDVSAEAMNAALPEGFRVSQVLFPAENSPSLGKSCTHAEYFIRNTLGIDILDTAKCFYGSSVLKAEYLNGWIRLILNEPAQNPIGKLIKHIIAQNLITGWHQVNIVRSHIGSYDQQKDCVSIHE